MKNSRSLRIPTLIATVSLSLLAFAGCSDRSKTETHIDNAVDKTKEVAGNVKDAMADTWGDVKAYSFEKSDDFKKKAKELSSKLDADMSKLRADYSEAKATAARKAAMAELKNSEANYQEKLAALGKASGATWDAAKLDVVSAWDRLQAAYYKARAE